MARRPNPRTPTTTYRSVTIRYYPRKTGWKSTFNLHGQKRRECYGPTQADAEVAAQEAITLELNPEAIVARNDEAAARAKLAAHGVSLVEAANFWLTKHARPLVEGTVKEVRQRWLDARAKKGFHYRKSLSSRSQHLEEAFGDRKIASLTLVELATWQDALEANFEGRTVRNIHDACKQMFKFGRKRGYLESDRITAMEDLDRPTAEPSKKAIFKPEQMQKLLDAAWGLASPAAVSMVITAFTAIRSEELYTVDPEAEEDEQLLWEDFRWKENYIYIRDNVAKLKIARNVPMSKILIRMLEPLKGTGQVYTETRLDAAYARIARRAKIGWQHNALRHSAITYRMLLTNSPAEVANWAGNSVSTIEAAYRNRGATKDEAVAWFKLRPQVAWGAYKTDGADD